MLPDWSRLELLSIGTGTNSSGFLQLRSWPTFLLVKEDDTRLIRFLKPMVREGILGSASLSLCWLKEVKSLDLTMAESCALSFSSGSRSLFSLSS